MGSYWKENTFEERMLYFKYEKKLLTNSIWIYTNTNIQVKKSNWEIFAKKFTLDLDSGYKDAAQIQNDLL